MQAINSNEGCQLIVSSAYRSYQTQERLFNDKILRVMAIQPELENNRLKAEEIAELEVARPGTSQHMTGRVIDFTTRSLYEDYLLNKSKLWRSDTKRKIPLFTRRLLKYKRKSIIKSFCP